MLTKVALRAWVSPAVAFTFSATSATGILMLLDIDLMEDFHPWMGLVFTIAGVFSAEQ